jgi:hypothetical protein
MDDDEVLPAMPATPPMDPETAAQVAQLKALQAQLQAAQAAGAHVGDVGDVGVGDAAGANDAVVFGYTFSGLMAGLLWSTVAIAMFRYAKINGQFLWAICGVLLFALTYMSSNAVVLWAGGAAIMALTAVVKRFVTF